MSNLAISLDAALAELATDPIGVLRASGVRGQAGDCDWHPVAQFIRQQLDNYFIVVRADYVLVDTGRVLDQVKLCPAIQQAIRAIDAGEHPELCR